MEGGFRGKYRLPEAIGCFASAWGPLIQLSGCQTSVLISSGISSWLSAARLCPRERWGPTEEPVNSPWSQLTGCTAGTGSVCQCRCGARSQELAEPAWPQQMLLLALGLASSLSLGHSSPVVTSTVLTWWSRVGDRSLLSIFVPSS